MSAPRFTLASRIPAGLQVCQRRGHLRDLVVEWGGGQDVWAAGQPQRGSTPRGVKCPRCGTVWMLDGSVMIDPPRQKPITVEQAWALLEGDREFTVTPGHVALLRAARVNGDELAIDRKRPFGNSAVYSDMAKLVDPDFVGLGEGAQDDYLDEHHEALVQMLAELGHVLSIALAGAGEIEPGQYVRESSWAPWRLASA